MRVLYNIAPVLPGHSLVVPKRHVVDITELTDQEIVDMLRTIKKVKPVILGLYGDSSKSYDATAQIGEYSGMSIKHLHLHIIPRKENDKYEKNRTAVYSEIERTKRLSEEEYRAEIEKLRKAMKWNEKE